MENKTSLVKTEAKPVVTGEELAPVVKAVESAFIAVERAFNAYFQWEVEREKTKQLKALYKSEVEKANIMLKALQKKIDLNLKYLKYQSRAYDKHRKAILKQISRFHKIASIYRDAHIKMLSDKNIDQTRIKEIGDKISECFAKIAELTKELRPQNFATIDM